MSESIREIMARQERIWMCVPEPRKSEMLSLFGERIVADPHLPPAYLAQKVRAEIFRQERKRAIEEIYHDIHEDYPPLEDIAEINLILAQLSPDQRRVIELLVMGNSTLSEVAEAMGCTLWRVRTLRDAAMVQIKKALA